MTLLEDSNVCIKFLLNCKKKILTISKYRQWKLCLKFVNIIAYLAAIMSCQPLPLPFSDISSSILQWLKFQLIHYKFESQIVLNYFLIFFFKSWSFNPLRLGWQKAININHISILKQYKNSSHYDYKKEI